MGGKKGQGPGEDGTGGMMAMVLGRMCIGGLISHSSLAIGESEFFRVRHLSTSVPFCLIRWIWTQLPPLKASLPSITLKEIQTTLPPRHNPPSPNQIIRIPREKRLPVRTPRQTHTLGLPALLPHSCILGLQLIHLTLLLQIKNNDTGRSGGAEPVSVGGEDEGVDLVARGEGVEVFGFVEVPEHCRAVFAAGGAEGAVGADGDGVYVARVADVVGLDAAVGEFPDLWIGGGWLAED